MICATYEPAFLLRNWFGVAFDLERWFDPHLNGCRYTRLERCVRGMNRGMMLGSFR